MYTRPHKPSEVTAIDISPYQEQHGAKPLHPGGHWSIYSKDLSVHYPRSDFEPNTKCITSYIQACLWIFILEVPGLFILREVTAYCYSVLVWKGVVTLMSNHSLAQSWSFYSAFLMFIVLCNVCWNILLCIIAYFLNCIYFSA